MDEAAMLATVRERLARARRVLVVTGAGISAESGIPTFRGADGYWRNHRAEELASPEGFARDPQLVWEWYDHRRRLVAECEPNAGHQAVAALERRAPEFMLITQNVDGLHRLAGSERVVELHGNIWRVKRADGGGAPFEDRELRDKDQLPPRDEAGRLLRPDIVWFGEILPEAELRRIDDFLSRGDIDVCFVIGTSAVFHYIVNFALSARAGGALVVEVNPEPSLPAGLAEAVFAQPAGAIMPQLLPDS